jgi:tetratricopeptide (TPR) repeat protein
MTESLKHRDLQRHAWLAQLESSPHDAVSDLMAGYAAIFPFTRADAPDAARMLFGHLPPDDPARVALGTGILSWLASKREEKLSSNPARLQNFVRQIGEAFEIISLIELTEPALVLRQQYLRWFDWVSRLNIAPTRDARADYLRMLANTQSILAERLADPDALAPFWMRVCREAGSIYPKSYLQIGLLGLRRLPKAIEKAESPWIAGLAAWAKEHNPSNKEFMQVWLPIKRMHPASPRVLRKRVFDVLSQKLFSDANIVPPGWWENDPDFPKRQDAARRAHHFEPPAFDLTQDIISKLQNKAGFSDIQDRLTNLVERHENYATASGDDYYLVRAFCYVGQNLLRNSVDAHSERAHFAEQLARKTLRYQPNNPIAWGLWRDALFNGGAFDASVALGWETIRRLPNDPLKRNELAEILISLGRPQDALTLLEGSVQVHVFDVVTYSVLSRIYANFGNEPAARTAIKNGLIMEPDNRDLHLSLKNLDEGRPLPLVANARKAVIDAVDTDAKDITLSELKRSGKLRDLRQRLQNDRAATEELKEILITDPTFAYAQILAARHKIWHVSDDGLPIFAAAFEDALAKEDLKKLDALTEQMPKFKSLTLLAKAILGDASAAEEVANLLRHPGIEDDKAALEILSARFQPVFKLINGGRSATEAIHTCSSELRIAIYDTNEAISAPELMAA